MSNLVPTPIVDKNGVVSTRHKKLDKAPGKKKNVPSPSAPAPNRLSIDQLMDLIYLPDDYGQKNATVIKKELSTLRDVASEGFALLEERWSTGSKPAHEIIRQKVHVVVSSLRYTRSLYGRHPEWEDELNAFKGRVTPELVKMWWNAGNVLHENGNDDGVGVIGQITNVMDHHFRKHVTLERDDVFWRGVTALALTNDYFIPLSSSKKKIEAERAEYYRSAQSFISYAGAHDDIALVIRTAIERRTLSVETIDGVVAQHAEAPLRSGIL